MKRLDFRVKRIPIQTATALRGMVEEKGSITMVFSTMNPHLTGEMVVEIVENSTGLVVELTGEAENKGGGHDFTLKISTGGVVIER